MNEWKMGLQCYLEVGKKCTCETTSRKGRKNLPDYKKRIQFDDVDLLVNKRSLKNEHL